jgi:hypothetical protein
MQVTLENGEVLKGVVRIEGRWLPRQIIFTFNDGATQEFTDDDIELIVDDPLFT